MYYYHVGMGNFGCGAMQVILLFFSKVFKRDSRAIRGKYGFSWKELDEKLQQRFVAYYFENGFLNPLGMTGICGLFFSSLYAYGYSFAGDYMDQYWWMQCVGYWLFMGQGISMYIQTYFIVNFFQLLLEVDEKQKLKLANGKRRAIKAKK